MEKKIWSNILFINTRKDITKNWVKINKTLLQKKKSKIYLENVNKERINKKLLKNL